MSSPEIGQLHEILACAQDGVTRRRQAEVDDLKLLLTWADSHGADPQSEPNPVPVKRGGPRLVAIGGQGTPAVVDLCFAEMAIARRASEIATRHATADALDLRHRLPLVWAQMQDLACETWVARKVARMSRPLSRAAVQVVDQAVADAISQSPSRLLAIAEAKVVEADQTAHAARVAESRTRRGVWFPKPRPGDLLEDDGAAGVRSVFGRLDEADAVELEQAIDDVAELLVQHGAYDDVDQPTWDQLRAESLGLLARPADVLALLRGENPNAARTSSRSRRKARLVVHVTDTTLCGTAAGIARTEHLGPMVLDQVARVLGHRDIEILPVIDLREVRAVNGYEHPTDVRNRTMMRTLGDVFPHSAARPEARVDHDHPIPYDPTGPPAQTGDRHDAPLTRRHHRVKTHRGYRVDQLAPGIYRWATPNGLVRFVTPAGTTLDPPQPAPLRRIPLNITTA
ncbi:hypothetical protein [Demetria terragena]|uniref:hypothetical protein n=1 Tax=Demetria terragena TaxID=63959 RepID=UPI0003769B88|nr:hypothetical protein [Demetria terragena]